jgi:membrane associated rhomboid family serine protease
MLKKITDLTPAERRSVQPAARAVALDFLQTQLDAVTAKIARRQAFLAQIAVNPTSPVPTVGASGAIAGVFGAYLLLFPGGRVRVFFFLGPLSHIARISALLFIGFWFVMQFFSGVGSLGVKTAETGGVAYWAHLGGFLAGLVLAWLYKAFLARPARLKEA